jgi:hypothetical protein
MPSKFKINHNNAVAFVRKVLADDGGDFFGLYEEIKPDNISGNETDLWYVEEKNVRTGKESDLTYTGVKVHEKFQFDRTGLLTNASRNEILDVYTKFVSEDKLPFRSRERKGKVDVKKILVFTNWQVLQQFEDLLRRRKSVINTTDVKLLLIQYPIFKNDNSGIFGNFVKNCSNKTLTVPELITAIKFGIVKLNALPKDLRDAMWIMLTKHGYPSYNVVKQKRKEKLEDD